MEGTLRIFLAMQKTWLKDVAWIKKMFYMGDSDYTATSTLLGDIHLMSWAPVWNLSQLQITATVPGPFSQVFWMVFLLLMFSHKSVLRF